MTFILVKRINGIPTIFGDLLISELNNPNPHTIDLPALKASTLDHILPREEWFPAVKDLKRKIVKINQNFVIAWTGLLVSAEAIIRNLFLTFSEKVPSISDLFAYLEQYKLDRVPELVIIGWTLDGKDYQSFRWDFDTNQGSSGDEVYIDGSGADAVREIIRNSKGTIEGKISNYEHFMNQVLGLITILKGDELITGKSINSLYGGGIEFLYLQGNEFTYPPKISNIFWLNLYRSRDEQKISLINPIIEYWYENENLIIKSNEFELIDGNFEISRKYIYPFPPLTKEFLLSADDKYRIENSSFISSIYSIFVYSEIDNTNQYRECTIHIYEYDKRGLVITSSDDSNNYISFNSNIFNVIKEHVHHAVINNPYIENE